VQDPLSELMDRQQIADLVTGYCLALDAMDLETLTALFTQDCLVDYGPGPGMRSVGASRLQQDLARMWRWSRTSHHSSNVHIVFTSEDFADVTSSVYAWHERPDGSTATMMGQYRDQMRRTVDGWRIASRTQVLTGNDAGFDVAINPFDRRPDPQGKGLA